MQRNSTEECVFDNITLHIKKKLARAFASKVKINLINQKYISKQNDNKKEMYIIHTYIPCDFIFLLRNNFLCIVTFCVLFMTKSRKEKLLFYQVTSTFIPSDGTW